MAAPTARSARGRAPWLLPLPRKRRRGTGFRFRRFHSAVERGAVDAEQLRRLADVAAREAQRCLDVAALPGLEGLVEVERSAVLEQAQGLLDDRAGFAAGAWQRRLEIEL